MMRHVRFPIPAFTRSVLSLLFPRGCFLCGCGLAQTEEALCTACYLALPFTACDDVIEQRFFGQKGFVRASALFFYNRDSRYRRLIRMLKYDGETEIGEALGRYLSATLQHAGFFDDIDLIIPVPLYHTRLKKRGYNQSEYVAAGVASVTGLPVDSCSLARTQRNATQTVKSLHDRWGNVKDAFTLFHPEQVAGKHILLVDDVLTTGATLSACIRVLAQTEGTRASVLTLGVAK